MLGGLVQVPRIHLSWIPHTTPREATLCLPSPGISTICWPTQCQIQDAHGDRLSCQSPLCLYLPLFSGQKSDQHGSTLCSTPCHTRNARLVRKFARQLLVDMLRSRQWSPWWSSGPVDPREAATILDSFGDCFTTHLWYHFRLSINYWVSYGLSHYQLYTC